MIGSLAPEPFHDGPADPDTSTEWDAVLHDTFDRAGIDFAAENVGISSAKLREVSPTGKTL